MILYFVFVYVDKFVGILKLNGFVLIVKNVIIDNWKFWLYEYMYIKGNEIGLIKEFLDYMKSDKV